MTPQFYIDIWHIFWGIFGESLMQIKGISWNFDEISIWCIFWDVIYSKISIFKIEGTSYILIKVYVENEKGAVNIIRWSA